MSTNNATGFTRLIVTMLLCVVGVAALAGCGEAGVTSNADLLKQAIANMRTASSYAMNADFNEEGQAIKMSGQFDVAGNSSNLQIESPDRNASVIMIGDTAYISTDGGATFTNAGDQSTSITQSVLSFVQMWNNFPPDQIDKHKDELKDGSPATEQIGGVDAKHITGNARDLSLPVNSNVTTTGGIVEFWVSPGNPYVVQMKINGIANDQPVQGTYNWSSFNQKFDIKVPPTSLLTAPLAAASR